MIKLVLVETSHNYVIPFWPDHISHTLKISPFWRTVWWVETSFHDVFFKFVVNISTRAVSSCHIITKEAVFIFCGPSEAELWSRGPNDLCKMSSWGWPFWLAKIVLTNLVIPSVRRKRKKKNFFFLDLVVPELTRNEFFLKIWMHFQKEKSKKGKLSN